MKPTASASSITITEALETPKYVKFTAIALLSISLLFLANRFSFSYSDFSPSSSSSLAPSEISIHVLPPVPSPPPSPFPPPPSPPPPPVLWRTGIIDETGAMSDDFWVGDFDSRSMNLTDERIEEETEREGQIRSFKVTKFEVCDVSKTDYIPCLDNQEAIKGLSDRGRGERYERHCPAEGKGLGCLVPRPKGYRTPIPWPLSRDEASQCDPLTNLYALDV